MTGSAVAPVVIPVVIIVALAAWLAMVFYADAHPPHAGRRTASEPGTAPADIAPRPVRPEASARDGEDATGGPSPAPARHAA
jgi:hypothetical protein